MWFSPVSGKVADAAHRGKRDVLRGLPFGLTADLAI